MGRDFRWLLASSWTSNIGDGVALAAAPLLIASMTSSPILVAAGAILQFLPWLLFGLHAGAIADRFDRRRLVMFANAARAVVLAALCIFLITGVANIWIVLAVAFLYGTAEVFVDTAGSTLLPMLVKPADLGIGNARLQAGYLVANQFAGPPLGAFLFAAGTAWPFLLEVVCVSSTTVRQRLVPAELQGRVASVNMVGVFGGMVVGQALGGVIAQVWGLTAPWWFAFVGAALTLLLVWKPISQIVSAKPIADTGPEDAEPASQSANEP
ncbi:MFS transporter [Microbacterium maritypicum]